jgi:hypothetical protein
MQSEYLARLVEPVQEFIFEVEAGAGLEIKVILDSKLNERGPAGNGTLEVAINPNGIQLFAPTNGYFPDGAVRHEVLHVQRFHIDGVPKLVLARKERDYGFSNVLGGLDIAIEHVVIVPVELQFHPERREHWEVMMSLVWSDFPYVPEGDRCLAACLHWTFLRHVLPSSPQIVTAKNLMNGHGLLRKANDFSDQFLSAASKEEMVRILFLTFPEIPKNRAALEYINSITGTRQTPIP